ncbi:MAG: HU family DNA-binding protein [Aquificaceae bacterium]
MVEKRQKSSWISLFEELINLVLEKGRLELRGFGVFKMRKFGGRFIKNPRTGVELYMEERYSIGFKPSSTFNKDEKG